MKTPRILRFEERRKEDFSAELRKRAQAWIPSWDLGGGERDFGHALLEIAARFNAEVAERLDKVGDKMRRGFLDWLAVRGEAARPSRMPVVLKLTDSAQEAVLASAPVRMQVGADGTSVIFETEKDLRVVPGHLDVVVGVNADEDEFYLSPPGLSDLKPLEPVPTQWVLKSYASVGATKLQLDPDSGLERDMIIEAAGRQYRITKLDNEIVSIEPALASELPQSSMVRKVTTFAPFDGVAINRQEHALYLGHMDLLNIKSAATIEVVGATALRTGVIWQYWGKVEGNDEVGWQLLTIAANQKQQPDAVVLEKKKGAIEPYDVAGKKSRWIRARVEKVKGASSPLLQTDRIDLQVNCQRETIPCPPNNVSQTSTPPAEAMANTTPLVLDRVFFPLGKEPRQFDAFYLGSEEVFSKNGAKVQLCFEMADPTFSVLSVVSGVMSRNTSVLGGVGKDRALHLYEFKSSTGDITELLGRGALQPPLPGYAGQANPGNTVQLDQPSWRLPMWTESDSPPTKGFCAAVAAGDAIWVWHEHPNPTSSGWIDLGSLRQDGTGGLRPLSGLVYLSGTSSKIMALHGGLLFARDWPTGTEWKPVPTDVELKSIVPVLVADTQGRLVTSLEDGMVGISDDNKLFSISASGACKQLGTFSGFDSAIRPVAIMDGASLIVVAVDNSDPQNLVFFAPPAITTKEPLSDGDHVTGAIDVLVSNGVHFVASVKSMSGDYLASWSPFALNPDEQRLLKSMIPPGIGPVWGAPTLVGQHVLIPSTSANVLVAEFDVTARRFRSANIEIGVVVPDSIPDLTVNDLIVRMVKNLPRARAIMSTIPATDGEVFYPLKSKFPSGATGQPLAYSLSSRLIGTFTPPNKLRLASGDFQTTAGDWLRMDDRFFKIKGVDPNDPTLVTIMTTSGKNPPSGTTGIYVRPIATGGRVAPFMRLDPLVNGNWDASVLTRIPLFFPDETPKIQRAKAFSVDPGNHPIVVVLEEEFKSAVANPVKFILDPSIGAWSRILGDTSSNPELSWEYWNGKGWWKLDALDSTRNLKSTGAVEFEVPADIASGDWSGKTNFWIRGRLIGGDYGREKITVHIKSNNDGSTDQTIDRSIEGIRPPSVVQLHISYSICNPLQPTFVLAQDSGSIRDQSDANRTAGAIVEAFVPLALMLGRLSRAGLSSSPSENCPPDCQCHSTHGADIGMPTSATSPPTTAMQPVSGRALFIGLDATLSGAPVNVLLLVDQERPHGEFAPLKIEALVADRFVSIVADDGTRAVGESGLVSMAFTVPPTRGELFGNTLTWLRLSPRAGTDTTQWKLSLRGAYLNAEWASATETLTRELVGSSDGAPNLMLRLARPPVLHGTLELRVKEPLGDEERLALRKDDARRVLSDVQDLPGDWVLWKQVTDPSDEPATERVYAFDESTGEIRFGDGRHGMIPPIGRDSIVAFSYQHTEPPQPGSNTVPGNLIAPRTALNLVSPVEGVEAVTAADQAAGGASPEPDDRVLRFGFSRLRHRNRAVTPQDLEDLALQSSPDIAQARCFLLRGFVRLVVVMRGRNPIPNAAQIRELHRLLLSVAPTALRVRGALRIDGPAVRRLRIELTLRVETLDHAGVLSEDVKKRLATLFDTASGGSDQDGWALGVNPGEEDIALALVDAPHLESIAAVSLHEVVGNDVEQAWPTMLKPVELTVLHDDPIRIQFETTGVMA